MISEKFHTLRVEVQEKGMLYGVQSMLSFALRPAQEMVFRHRLLLALVYGIPISFSKVKYIRYDKPTKLGEDARYFWYANQPGSFDLDGEKISRREIFVYGGPNPKFSCLVCQKAEWLSRVRQKNLFEPHACPQATVCKSVCAKQGNELYTHLHQNFDFSLRCDPHIPAPKGLIMKTGKERQKAFFSPSVAMAELVGRRRFAFTSQIEGVEGSGNIDWPRYDFLFVTMPPGICIRKFPRPDIPIILSAHDWWPLENQHFQWTLDWLKPDVFLTPFPTPWKERCTIPSSTKVVFYPLFDSNFFTRPNLGEKAVDLLIIGATTSSDIYQGRIALDEQVRQLAGRYAVEFSHLAGARNIERETKTLGKDARTGLPMRFLNKWSEYLGSAKYVIFGRMKYQAVTIKHYEVLGSGAVPIFPEAEDLKLLGVKPFEHYIPLSEVEGNNEKLQYFLDNYGQFRHIAENAVAWYKKNADRMLFDDFEKVIREVTGYAYPKRLV